MRGVRVGFDLPRRIPINSFPSLQCPRPRGAWERVRVRVHFSARAVAERAIREILSGEPGGTQPKSRGGSLRNSEPPVDPHPNPPPKTKGGGGGKKKGGGGRRNTQSSGAA